MLVHVCLSSLEIHFPHNYNNSCGSCGSCFDCNSTGHSDKVSSKISIITAVLKCTRVQRHLSKRIYYSAWVLFISLDIEGKDSGIKYVYHASHSIMTMFLLHHVKNVFFPPCNHIITNIFNACRSSCIHLLEKNESSCNYQCIL